MEKKYIIELEDEPFIQHFKNGAWETIYRVKGFNSLVFDWNGLQMLTPYTEPDTEQVRKKAYDKCMNEAEDLAYKLYSPKIDEAYQRGLNDAWDCVDKINSMSHEEQEACFGRTYLVNILELEPSEAIEKIRQHEQEKEEQIQVGDEVNAPFGKAIVVNINSVAEKIWLVYADGHGGFEYFKDAPTKTGRHFPEIAEVMQKMKESDNG